MDALDRSLKANRAALRERLRMLIGEEGHAEPTGQALSVALTRPLAESGLLLQSPGRQGRPLVAASGDPAQRHLVLLFNLARVDPAAEPGGPRAGLVAALAALAALRAADQLPPFGLTLICEHERSGSTNLEGLGLAPVDDCLWDGGGYSEGRPWVALGSHGLARLRLRAVDAGGPAGLGAIVPNPAWRLIWALAALKRMDEEVHIPGFYEAVRAPEPAEAAALEDVAPAVAASVQARGARPLPGLPARSLALVQAFSPAVSITALGAEGPAGQLPAAAWAEVTLTLVPEQRPADIVSALVEYLEGRGLADVAVEVVGAYPGQTTEPDAPLATLVQAVAREAFGHAPAVWPYGEHQAPVARLPARGALAAIGIGPGHAPWPELEERVVRQARLLAMLLIRLAARSDA